MSMLLTVWRKELLDSIRDRRSFMAAMSYAVFGPALMAVAFMALISEATSEKPVYVAIDGADYAPSMIAHLAERDIHPASDENPATNAIQLTIPADYAELIAKAQPVAVVIRSDRSERSD